MLRASSFNAFYVASPAPVNALVSANVPRRTSGKLRDWHLVAVFDAGLVVLELEVARSGVEVGGDPERPGLRLLLLRERVLVLHERRRFLDLALGCCRLGPQRTRL